MARRQRARTDLGASRRPGDLRFAGPNADADDDRCPGDRFCRNRRAGAHLTSGCDAAGRAEIPQGASEANRQTGRRSDPFACPTNSKGRVAASQASHEGTAAGAYQAIGDAACRAGKESRALASAAATASASPRSASFHGTPASRRNRLAYARRCRRGRSEYKPEGRRLRRNAAGSCRALERFAPTVCAL